MLTLRLSFPWGRYYAHPWGQNPARLTEAEWPPSPWRLLRALAAAWFQANPGREASAELIQTLEALGGELPVFFLPKVSFSKLVQYHPNYGAAKKQPPPKAKLLLANCRYHPVRIENHFVGVGGDVLIRWQLAEASERTVQTVRSLLGSIVGRISYLGRAESVCEVEVVDAAGDDRPAAEVVIHAGKPCRQIGSAFRDVFCPNPDSFQVVDLWQRRADNAGPGVARKHLVQELLDAPQPLPDGAAWFSYRMPTGWPERWIVRHAKPAKRTVANHRIVARFLEFSLQCRIPVPTKFTVSIAEFFRDAAIGIHFRNYHRPSFALSGHDGPEGYKTGHNHAFYLPTPDDSGQYLSQLRVWCPYGFNQQEVNSLMGVGALRWPGDDDGDGDDLAEVNSLMGVGALRWAGGRFPVRPVLLRMQSEIPECSTSRVWRSVTPFVPPRHWYRKKIEEGRVRGPDSPENQLQFCFRENGTDPSLATILRVDVANSGWEVCKVHQHEDAPFAQSSSTHRIGLLLEVIFPEPITLPFPSYGHSAHFGLGQFDTDFGMRRS